MTIRLIDRPRYFVGFMAAVAYVAMIPLANWLIGNVGLICYPNGGPCTVPVWPGIECPSGSLMIGFALVFRDVVQRLLGKQFALAAICVGVMASIWVAPPSLVVASAVAFVVSELADFAVYTPLQRKRFIIAVIASSIVGLTIDSILFLWLAFGSLDLLAGLVIGKAEMVVLTLPAMFWIRNHFKEGDR